jgi:3-dehydroquinate dehydratase type I
MTLVAVPIEVEDPRDVATALEQAQQAKSGGADLVEFRIDVLVEHAEGVTAARRLVQESPLPVLLTCRSDAEGGSWRFVSRSGGHGRGGPSVFGF